MSCAQYKLLISRYLDDDISLRDRNMLMAHLVNCPRCAATLARYRGIEVSLRKLPETQPSPAVRDNLLCVIEQGSNASKGSVGRSARYAWKLRLPRFFDVDVLQIAKRMSLSGLPVVFVIALAGLLVVYASQIGLIQSGRNTSLDSGVSAPLVSGKLLQDSGQTYTPVSNSSHVAVALAQMLRQTRSNYPIRLPLPAYIPAGMQLERFSINPGGEAGSAEDMEVDFKAQDGKMVRIRHGMNSVAPAVPAKGSRLVAAGREWWVQQHPTLSQNGAQAYVIFTKQNGEVVVLDAVLPLDELIRVVDSIEWAEEGK